MYASHQGYTEIVELLLKHGADPDLQSSVSSVAYVIRKTTCDFVKLNMIRVKGGLH